MSHIIPATIEVQEIARRLLAASAALGGVLYDREEILEMKTRNSERAQLIEVKGTEGPGN